MAYAVMARIGRGGMGVVDLATDDHGRQVALKRVPLHGTPEDVDTARRRIRREAEVLRSLRHPGIVGLLEVLDDGDDVVLVMPYQPGGTMAERVAHYGPRPVDEVAALAPALLRALAAAHRQGVIHRDIKPGNVLFDANGAPLLADFGVALSRDVTRGLTGTDVVVGTPSFMAPEQARGEPAGPAADVFSLGATLRFALTGRGPYGSGDARVLMHRAAAGRVERLPRWIPRELRRLLDQMCRADPRRRPTTAALAPAPEGTAVRTLRRSRFWRSRFWRSRFWRSRFWRPRVWRRVGIGTVLASVLALVATAVAVSLPDGDEAEGLTPPSTTGAGAPCTPLPYQPCGEPPAPHTDGRTCVDGHDDYDGAVTNGCEAAPDSLDGILLVDSIEANLVPADDVDTYTAEVDDRASLFCEGAVSFVLTAAPGVAQRIVVLDGEEVLGAAASADGTPAEVQVEEACLRDDSADLTIVVSSVGGDRSAESYTLERSGSL